MDGRLLLYFLISFMFFQTSAWASSNPRPSLKALPHIDLEATALELVKIYQLTHPVSQGEGPEVQGALDPVLKMGKRNLDWLQIINAARSQGDKLSFSSKATQSGIPIESPKNYNESTVQKSFDDLKKNVPNAMASVIFSNAPLGDQLPLPVDEYLQWGRKIDGIYQTAVRWLTMKNYLPGLAARRSRDIRGVYFFAKEPNLEANLTDFQSLSPEKKANYQDWLISMCLNGGKDIRTCQSELSRAITRKTVLNFYNRYLADAQATWDSYFAIPAGSEFSDVRWSAKDPNLAVVPLEAQSTTELQDFLRINLEDEWKWLSWNLKLDFASASKNSVKVYWQPNIVPHVPYLGANEIYMDSNTPLSEYNVQWTIRHEFGHVLGFPDCYNEFYDEDLGLIVSYQLDISDLMCSRRGRLLERHFFEMQKTYFSQK